MVTKALDILNKAYSSQSDMFELADRTQVRVKQVKKIRRYQTLSTHYLEFYMNKHFVFKYRIRYKDNSNDIIPFSMTRHNIRCSMVSC